MNELTGMAREALVVFSHPGFLEEEEKHEFIFYLNLLTLRIVALL